MIRVQRIKIGQVTWIKRGAGVGGTRQSRGFE